MYQPEIDEEEEEQLRVNREMAARREYAAGIEAHEEAWANKHKKEKVVMKRLPSKTWKGVNSCKTAITGGNITKLLWVKGMTQRYSKSYRKHFPTWHAIGKKWQGQIHNLLVDIIKQVERHKDCGGYESDLWEDNIEIVVMKVYNRVILRYHAHCNQILRSMLSDRSKLDWGMKDLHTGLLN